MANRICVSMKESLDGGRWTGKVLSMTDDRKLIAKFGKKIKLVAEMVVDDSQAFMSRH